MSLSAMFDAAAGVAHSAIEGLAALLTPIVGGAAAAVAIVLFTVAVRSLISPLSYLQIRGERRRAALAPQIAELQRKHRDDPPTLAAETLSLYRANGARPLAGLLPGLAQAPFFMIMYRVTLDAPAGSFLGVPLSAHLVAGLPAFSVLLAVALALAWWSSHRMRRRAAPRSFQPAEGRCAGTGRAASGGRAPILDSWLPFRRATPNMCQQDLQDRAKRRRADRTAKGRHPVRYGRPGRGTGMRRGGGKETGRDGGAFAAIMPWLPFTSLPVVAWLPLGGALYLVTSMAWTALERVAYQS